MSAVSRRRAWTSDGLPPIAGWLLVCVVVSGCGPGMSDPSAASTPPPAGTASPGITMNREQIQRGGVRWEPVSAVTMTDTVAVTGQLAPNEDRTVRLSAPARARVVTVHVRIGDRVSPKQPLVTLQSEQAATARAEYAKAVAELKSHQTAERYARTALERAERLLELKAISRQDVERARVDSEEAESMRVQSQAEVDRARTTLTELGVNDDTGAIVLTTPFAGIVLSRDVVPGSVVEAGTLLMTVTEPNTLWLEIAATERVAPVLRPGSQVTFTVTELLPETFTATVESVGAALDPLTRTLPVRALVRNTAERLRPAMFATVTLSVGEPRDGVAVPEGAMQLLDERPVVFVASEDGQHGARFERRDVDVGAKTADRVHVVRGLNPGDVVVTAGAFAVKSEFARSRTPANQDGGSRP